MFSKGKNGGAVDEFEKAKKIRGSFRPDVFQARLYGLKGESDKAFELLGRIREAQKGIGPWAYGYAIIYTALGDKDKALDWLEQSHRAKESGVIIYIRSDPALDSLRGNPRFEKLVDRIVPRDKK